MKIRDFLIDKAKNWPETFLLPEALTSLSMAPLDFDVQKPSKGLARLIKSKLSLEGWRNHVNGQSYPPASQPLSSWVSVSLSFFVGALLLLFKGQLKAFSRLNEALNSELVAALHGMRLLLRGFSESEELMRKACDWVIHEGHFVVVESKCCYFQIG